VTDDGEPMSQEYSDEEEAEGLASQQQWQQQQAAAAAGTPQVRSRPGQVAAPLAASRAESGRAACAPSKRDQLPAGGQLQPPPTPTPSNAPAPSPPQTFAQPGPCSFLAPGQAFSGAQRMPGDSREEDWKVSVRIQVRVPPGRPPGHLDPGGRAAPSRPRPVSRPAAQHVGPCSCSCTQGRAGLQLRTPAPAAPRPHARLLGHAAPERCRPTAPEPSRARAAQGYDHARGTLCGVMEALGVPSSRTPVVTAWEGEVGGRGRRPSIMRRPGRGSARARARGRAARGGEGSLCPRAAADRAACRRRWSTTRTTASTPRLGRAAWTRT
jgi:hypothetical protein